LFEQPRCLITTGDENTWKFYQAVIFLGECNLLLD